MTPLNPQLLFEFLENDPVFQRAQLAKEVSHQLLQDLRNSLCEEACSQARFEVRQLLPMMLTNSLRDEIRFMVRKAFGDEIRELQRDPADWWKLDDDDGTIT